MRKVGGALALGLLFYSVFAVANTVNAEAHADTPVSELSVGQIEQELQVCKVFAGLIEFRFMRAVGFFHNN